MAWPNSPKKETRSTPIMKVLKKFEFSQPLTTRYKQIFSAPQKKSLQLVGMGVYTMENKDTNTDYQKVVKVEGTRSEKS